MKKTAARGRNGDSGCYIRLCKNADRVKCNYLYIDKPLYTVNNVIAVSADESVQINSFEDIVALGDQGVILAVAGTGSLRFLELQNLPLKINASGQRARENLLKLLGNRERFFFS